MHPEYKKLREEWTNCQRCDLSKGRQKVVLGAGPVPSPIMLIGQWPGRDEDKEGLPVRGIGGTWTYKALAAGNIPWECVFFDNLLGCRAAKPKKTEKEACWPRLEQTIRIVSPGLIILAGAEASKWFYGKNVSGSLLAGRTGKHGEINVFYTTHPAEVVRKKSPDAQAASWANIVREYEEAGRFAAQLGLIPVEKE